MIFGLIPTIELIPPRVFFALSYTITNLAMILLFSFRRMGVRNSIIPAPTYQTRPLGIRNLNVAFRHI